MSLMIVHPYHLLTVCKLLHSCYPQSLILAPKKLAAKKVAPKTMAPGTFKRGPWSQQEDRWLLGLVTMRGPQNWVSISQTITSRSPKQCRERYHQNLKPSLNHKPISPEEGELIDRLVTAMGKRWAEIARQLNGRSDNAVKNWWNGGMNRRRRMVQRREIAMRNGQNEMDVEMTNCPQLPLPPAMPNQMEVSMPMPMPKLQSPYTPAVFINPQGALPPVNPQRTLPPLKTKAHRRSQTSENHSTMRNGRSIKIPDLKTNVERPLISPMSDANPPSLVEDNGSQFTPSPQLAQPPRIQSPMIREDNRRSFPTGLSPIGISPSEPTVSAFKFGARQPPPQAVNPLQHLAEMATTVPRQRDLVVPIITPPLSAQQKANQAEFAEYVAEFDRREAEKAERERICRLSQPYDPAPSPPRTQASSGQKDVRMNMQHLLG